MMQISDLEIKAIGQCVLISACDAFVLETRCLPRNNPCIRFLFSAFAANLSPSLLIFWLFLLVRAPYTIHLLKQSSLVKQFHATAHIQRGSFLRSFWRSDVDSLQPLWGKKKKTLLLFNVINAMLSATNYNHKNFDGDNQSFLCSQECSEASSSSIVSEECKREQFCSQFLAWQYVNVSFCCQ